MSERTSRARIASGRRASLGRALALAALGLLAFGAAPAHAEISCSGLIGPGTSPGSSVEYVFECNNTVRSYRVTVNKHVLPSPTAGSEDQGHPVQGEGFNCNPVPGNPNSFTCSGNASAGHTIRGSFGVEGDPCPTHVTVAAGTGPIEILPGQNDTGFPNDDPPDSSTFFSLRGDLCAPPPQRSPCIDAAHRDVCHELTACFDAGAALLYQPAAEAVEDTRRCVYLHRRYRLHSHDRGFHAHRRARLLRPARRSRFWKLYVAARERAARERRRG